MKNPAAITQPKLSPPIVTGKKKKNKGNLSYLKFRRKLRKDMFKKMM